MPAGIFVLTPARRPVRPRNAGSARLGGREPAGSPRSIGPEGRGSLVVLFNKPYGVLCQFSGDGTRPTLKDYIDLPGIYPAGRLDADSEGLVALTDDGALQARISGPRFKLPKRYWAQVEGTPSEAALRRLRTGIELDGRPTGPADVRRIDQPADLWPRVPPIRYRSHVPAHWIEIVIREGRNRQIRRMTAAIGHPTLRLVRCAIGAWSLQGLAPGAWRRVEAPQVR